MGWTKESDEGRLVARGCSELRQKLKGGGSECPESQSDGTAPNGTAGSALAVTGRSRIERINGRDRPCCEGIHLLKN